MIMNLKRSVRTTTTLLAGSATLVAVLLTGCSSAAPEGETPAGGTSTSASAPASSAPASSASSAPASSAGGGSEGKPSKEEVITGLTKFYQSTQGLDGPTSKKFAECMVGEMYEKATAKTMVALKEGKPADLDTNDTKLLADSSVTCAKVLA